MRKRKNEKTIEIEGLIPTEDSVSALRREIFSWVRMIVGVVVVVTLIQRFVFMSAEVHGRSMHPTLEDGERVILWSLLYSPSHSDIIIMEHTTGENYVKRVIGIPGDQVVFQNGNLYLNGVLVNEPYILDALATGNFTLEEVCQFSDCDTIPNHYFLVLGDNRGNSEDSRSFGLVHQSQIQGRVIWRFWPFDRFGTVE